MQHKQFRARRHGRAGLCHRRGSDGRRSLAALLRGAADEFDVEPLRLAQHITVGTQRVVPDVDEPVAVHQSGDRHGCFVQRELAADARPRAGAERLEQVDRSLPGPFGPEPVRIEDLDVVAPLRLPMQRRRQHRHGFTLPHRVPATDDGVCQSHSIEFPHRRGQAERLVDDLADVGELADLVEGRHVVVVGAEHRVRLGLRAVQHRRVLDDAVQGRRHQYRRRVLAGNQERGDLVADAVVVQQRHPVGTGLQHQGQEIVEVHVPRTVPADEVGDEAEQLAALGLEHRLVGVGAEQDLVQRGRETRWDVGEPVVLVGVETGPEAGQADGVHGQFRQVPSHVHCAGADGRIPLRQELPVDVQHRGVIAAQAAEAEAGDQDVVGFLPALLTGVGGEESVADHGTEPGQPARQRFGEPGLVAELVDQGQRARIEPLAGPEVGVEQRAVLLGEQIQRQRIGPPGHRPGRQLDTDS